MRELDHSAYNTRQSKRSGIPCTRLCMGVIHFNMEESWGSESHVTKLAAAICMLCQVTLQKQHMKQMIRWHLLFCMESDEQVSGGREALQSFNCFQLHSKLLAGSYNAMWRYSGESVAKVGRYCMFTIRTRVQNFTLFWCSRSCQLRSLRLYI
jgi:hypothetical protein